MCSRRTFPWSTQKCKARSASFCRGRISGLGLHNEIHQGLGIGLVFDGQNAAQRQRDDGTGTKLMGCSIDLRAANPARSDDDLRETFLNVSTDLAQGVELTSQD